MPGQERVARVVELDADRGRARPATIGRTSACAIAMGEVEDAERHAGRCTVRAHVAEPDGDEGRRPVDLELQLDHRRAEDLEALLERRPVEGQRAAVVLALVARELGALARRSRTGTTRHRRGPWLSATTTRGHPRDPAGDAALESRSPSRAEPLGRDARRRPHRLADPPSRRRRIERRRGDVLGHPGAEHRLVHDARVEALQPVVEPADDLGQEVELGPGVARCGYACAHGPMTPRRGTSRPRAAAGSRCE